MTVYVVQVSMRRNVVTGEREPSHDLSPALVHGQIVELLSPNALPHGDVSGVIGELHDKLSTYDPDVDFILPMGNVALISYAVAIAANITGGKVRLLLWDWKQRAYSVAHAILYEEDSMEKV